MSYLKINGTDISNLVNSLKIGYETLVSGDSGRNANGDTVLDVVNLKHKIYAGFRPMSDAEMKKFLGLIQGYVVKVTYRDSVTGTLKTITCYTGTPEPEYYWIQGSNILYKPFELNFIEM